MLSNQGAVKKQIAVLNHAAKIAANRSTHTGKLSEKAGNSYEKTVTISLEPRIKTGLLF
jgi:hypothetical protein